MTIEERLTKLERSFAAARRNMWIAIGFAGYLLAMNYLFDSPEPARNSSFDLLDDSGVVRGQLDWLSEGPYLTVRYPSGARSALSLAENNLTWWMADATRANTFSLSQKMVQGAPEILIGGQGLAGIKIRMGEDSPQITMFDKNGNAVWQAP